MDMDEGAISTELGQLFGAYFHQDWDLDADDWQGIADNYVKANPAAETHRQIAQEIDDMRMARTESDLGRFLINAVGVCYNPRPETTFREWLGHLAARLRTHADEVDGRTTLSSD